MVARAPGWRARGRPPASPVPRPRPWCARPSHDPVSTVRSRREPVGHHTLCADECPRLPHQQVERPALGRPVAKRGVVVLDEPVGEARLSDRVRPGDCERHLVRRVDPQLGERGELAQLSRCHRDAARAVASVPGFRTTPALRADPARSTDGGSLPIGESYHPEHARRAGLRDRQRRRARAGGGGGRSAPGRAGVHGRHRWSGRGDGSGAPWRQGRGRSDDRDPSRRGARGGERVGWTTSWRPVPVTVGTSRSRRRPTR